MTDLTGMRFGRLTFISFVRIAPSGHARWTVECDCGKRKEVRARCVLDGDTKSCGCGLRDMLLTRNVTHSMTGTPEHDAWMRIRARCTNRNKAGWEYYGGRGITVCERWQSFENFYADMGKRPSPKHSIDRIDNDRGYEPGNCRWATAKEQANNRRMPRKRNRRVSKGPTHE